MDLPVDVPTQFKLVISLTRLSQTDEVQQWVATQSSPWRPILANSNLLVYPVGDALLQCDPSCAVDL